MQPDLRNKPSYSISIFFTRDGKYIDIKCESSRESGEKTNLTTNADVNMMKLYLQIMALIDQELP